MPIAKYTPDEIIGTLRRVDVALAQGRTMVALAIHTRSRVLRIFRLPKNASFAMAVARSAAGSFFLQFVVQRGSVHRLDDVRGPGVILRRIKDHARPKCRHTIRTAPQFGARAMRLGQVT